MSSTHDVTYAGWSPFSLINTPSFSQSIETGCVDCSSEYRFADTVQLSTTIAPPGTNRTSIPVTQYAQAQKKLYATMEAGVPLKAKIKELTAYTASLKAQIERAQWETNTLWQAIEVTHGDQADADMVGVAWRNEQRTRGEWRAVIATQYSKIAQMESQHAALTNQELTATQSRLQTLRNTALNQIASAYDISDNSDAHYISYLKLEQSRDAMASLDDFTSARTFLAKQQSLLSQLDLPEAVKATSAVELGIRHAELVLLDSSADRAGLINQLASLKPTSDFQKAAINYTQATVHTDQLAKISNPSEQKFHLNAAIASLENVIAYRDQLLKKGELPAAELTTISQAQDLYLHLAAVQGVKIRQDQGAKAFKEFYQGLEASEEQFEARVNQEQLSPPLARTLHNQFANAQHQLAKILWAAGMYEDTFTKARWIQHNYQGTQTAEMLSGPDSWLYRLRPEAYAPGGWIREDLGGVSFSGLGAAYREAWAHTHENPKWVQYGAPVFGCVAGAMLTSKLGAAVGTPAGPEGTALGFGAGAATGCGIGAIAGKLVDWTSSVITAPEVAQAWSTGLSRENWATNYVRTVFGATDLVSTYYLGRALMHPTSGFSAGLGPLFQWSTRVATNTVLHPIQSAQQFMGGIRLASQFGLAAGEVASSSFKSLPATIAGLRGGGLNLFQNIPTVLGKFVQTYPSLIGVVGLSALFLSPNVIEAEIESKTTPQETNDSWFSPYARALAAPSALEWGAATFIMIAGTWAFVEAFWLDRVFLTSRIQTALGAERALSGARFFEGIKVNWQGAIVNNALSFGLWGYQQADAGNVDPIDLALSTVTTILFVVSAKYSRNSVEQMFGTSILNPMTNRFANWAREKGLLGYTFNPHIVRPQLFMPFLWRNIPLCLINDLTIGYWTLKPDWHAWWTRNLYQIGPRAIREAFGSVPFGIDGPLARFIDFFWNTGENLVFSWLMPPFTGKLGWVDDFQQLNSASQWNDYLQMFRMRMVRGVVNLTPSEHSPLLNHRLLPKDFADYSESLIKDQKNHNKRNALANMVTSRAEPDKFAKLSLFEKHVLIGHLVLFTKLPIQDKESADINARAQHAIMPYLHDFEEGTSLQQLQALSTEDLVERVNDIRF